MTENQSLDPTQFLSRALDEALPLQDLFDLGAVTGLPTLQRLGSVFGRFRFGFDQDVRGLRARDDHDAFFIRDDDIAREVPFGLSR
jgi:hypothetical protein